MLVKVGTPQHMAPRAMETGTAEFLYERLCHDAPVYAAHVSRGADLFGTGAALLDITALSLQTLGPRVSLYSRVTLALSMLQCIPPSFRMAFYDTHRELEALGLPFTRIPSYHYVLNDTLKRLHWPRILLEDAEFADFCRLMNCMQHGLGELKRQPHLVLKLKNSGNSAEHKEGENSAAKRRAVRSSGSGSDDILKTEEN